VFGGHEAPLSDVAFSPTQPIVASASWDGTVKLWNIFKSELVEVRTCYQSKPRRLSDCFAYQFNQLWNIFKSELVEVRQFCIESRSGAVLRTTPHLLTLRRKASYRRERCTHCPWCFRCRCCHRRRTRDNRLWRCRRTCWRWRSGPTAIRSAAPASTARCRYHPLITIIMCCHQCRHLLSSDGRQICCACLNGALRAPSTPSQQSQHLCNSNCCALKLPAVGRGGRRPAEDHRGAARRRRRPPQRRQGERTARHAPL
jgi:WD domain, G-beta repeat